MVMKITNYSKDGVNYVYDKTFRKWTFSGSFGVLIQSCPGGRNTAHKIANVVSGSVRRCGRLDGMARSIISKLTEK